LALSSIAKDITTATAWPAFKLGMAGLVTNPQLPDNKDNTQEPLLGEVFCANVFGHYMLAHYLMPLLRACSPDAPGRIIWVGSIEASARHYNVEDHQGMRSDAAYEHSKRLADLLAISSDDQPATSRSVAAFQDPSPGLRVSVDRPMLSRPKMYVFHPGICVTTIISLYWILHQGYLLGITLARVLGSPWSTVYPYTGARAGTWLLLASGDEIKERERQGEGRGKIKWGSAVSRLGSSMVKPTDVEGWGVNGSGEAFKDTWWGGRFGRAPGARDATREDVEQFVQDGARVWQEMEKLRVDWESRLEEYERAQSSLEQSRRMS